SSIDSPTTTIYTLSLHDALPIFIEAPSAFQVGGKAFVQDFIEPSRFHKLSLASLAPSSRGASRSPCAVLPLRSLRPFPSCVPSRDRKSTRLNSSHQIISYAVFCF